MANDWRCDVMVMLCVATLVLVKNTSCVLKWELLVADVDDNLRRGLFIAGYLVVLVLQVDSSLVTNFIQKF